MTSVQNFKPKLRPLYYSSKDSDVLDSEEGNLFDLQNNRTVAPTSVPTKQFPSLGKSFKSQKNKMSQNVMNAEVPVSSDDENVFVDLPKADIYNKNGLDTSFPPEKRMPLVAKKFNTGNTGQQWEQKSSKPVMNHTFGGAAAPSNTRINENTKEEITISEKTEENLDSKMDMFNNEHQGSAHKKNSKYITEIKSKRNKENYDNYSMSSPGQRFKENQVEKNVQRNQDKLSQGSEMLGHNYNMQQIRITEEREQRVPSEQSLPLTQNRQITEGYKGLSDISSEFVGKNYANKVIYKDILQDMQNMSLDPDNNLPTNGPAKANKEERRALRVVEERLGSKYASGLYEVFLRYCSTKDIKRKMMSLGKFLALVKDFELFDSRITKETASLAFIKRCPEKFADFASFVDVLYKVYKHSDFCETEILHTEMNPQLSRKDQMFGQYLQAKIFDKQDQMLISTDELKGAFSKLNLTETESNGLDYYALKTLDDYDEVLRKVFRSYWPWNTKYQGQKSDNRKNIMLVKEFKEFCYEYGLVPSLCSLNEILELFRKFQKSDEAAIDYKGFVYILCFIANLGRFSKGIFQNKFDTFAKKLSKLCYILAKMSDIVPERARRI